MPHVFEDIRWATQLPQETVPISLPQLCARWAVLSSVICSQPRAISGCCLVTSLLSYRHSDLHVSSNTMLQNQAPTPSAAFPPPHASGGSEVLNLTAGGTEGPVKEVGHVIWNPCNIWLFQNQTPAGVHFRGKAGRVGGQNPTEE